MQRSPEATFHTHVSWDWRGRPELQPLSCPLPSVQTGSAPSDAPGSQANLLCLDSDVLAVRRPASTGSHVSQAEERVWEAPSIMHCVAEAWGLLPSCDVDCPQLPPRDILTPKNCLEVYPAAHKRGTPKQATLQRSSTLSQGRPQPRKLPSNQDL